jgi:MFS transporter, DHA2 family, multidrug resistance protein
MTEFNPLPFLQRMALFVFLSLATFMIVLDYSIANVAIPYISGGLSVSNDQGTYVITSFAVGSAIGLALTGWLTKRVGEIKLMVLSIALFTFFSWTCGLSVNLEMLVIGRFIQGLVSGPIIPLSQSLILTEGTPESRNKDLSIWSLIVVAAPVVGPILGGYISDWYHWSWIFYINIPVGIVCSMGIWFIMYQRETKIERVPGDFWGIILLVIAVSCLQILLDKGEQWDWWNSRMIQTLTITSIVGFTFLIIRELWFPSPFLDLRIFANPSFLLSIICLMVSYGIYFGTIVLVPLWLQEYMEYNAEWAGLAVAALGIGPVFLALTTPKIIAKVGNVLTLIISFSFFAIGCFYTAFFTTDVDIFHIAFGRFIFGLGFVCYITPLFTMSVEGMTKSMLPNATGIFHCMRSIMGAVGTSVFTTLWIRRTIFHHERIGEMLTPYNPITPQASDPASLTLLNRSLDKQAALLAINDAFYLMSWLYVALIVLLLGWYFYSRRRPSTAAGNITMMD